ncbi:MAG: DNA-binding response regulator [gamma proteobacterium symbiont of Ctena orbiculata]|uniref:Response regulator transcription factor n=1 Tax=Candidatus Thiodiazotropha taylori TaxID=2792791 RepID=A0A944QTK4_9GAMM|nr:response regulator transcription factor [Candidatus Thiodiazotropha taylori]PUB84933.1 MAG: DNA-binding response regulator [gamma proteobacterium symbiont of Ctena orbiculata]MBT2990033.1 response regulator transcription factor [Candidatus Thiodiazotropha taylori]MBT2997948.1 response regulator transcription factor [Candidatus Thiodiazotropha taylori]MBT3001736.1 response regulator transcription factor [Candidatus Thiodiazotropha taylori]
MKKILLIDDDEALCELLTEYLVGEGFTVESVHTGPEGISRSAAEPWDAIVLDVMLPGMNGFDVLKQIQTQGSAPVLMLTARGDDTDTVLGLELGADDYVAKPCSPRVLVARLRNLFRRMQDEPAVLNPHQVGDLGYDRQNRRVTVGERDVALTGAEFNLLVLLLEHAGELVSKEVLAKQGLGRALQAYDRRIETHMAQIRKKLGPLPDGSPRIKTVRGAGYQYLVSQ